jgi:hypothetical protein
LTLESDTPTAQFLARQALQYKRRAEIAEYLLAQWEGRWHECACGAKGDFDSDEPGFSTLLDATRFALHGPNEPTAKDICREGLHIPPKGGSV